MARYVATIVTSKPAEEVFDYMADFTTVQQWDESVTRAERVEGAAPGKGTKFDVTFSFAGRENTFRYDTVEFDQPGRFLLRAESNTVISLDEVTVREIAEGTAVTYDATLKPKGLMKLVDPVLGLLFKRLGDNAAKGLARELGGQVA